MNSPSIPLANSRTHSLAGSLRRFLAAALQYADARLRLFWAESKEVLHRGLLLAGLAVTAVVGVLVTYAGLMVALVLWIARTWWEGDALPAVIIVALGHLLVAMSCAAWMASVIRRADIFHATLNEFKEDQQWLHVNQTSSN